MSTLAKIINTVNSLWLFLATHLSRKRQWWSMCTTHRSHSLQCFTSPPDETVSQYVQNLLADSLAFIASFAVGVMGKPVKRIIDSLRIISIFPRSGKTEALHLWMRSVARYTERRVRNFSGCIRNLSHSQDNPGVPADCKWEGHNGTSEYAHSNTLPKRFLGQLYSTTAHSQINI